MDVVHLHLLLNHVPVLGTIFVTALLAVAVYRGSSELAKVSLVSLAVVAVVGVLVYLTGEPAEHAVEQLPGVTESVIEPHEEAALVSTIALGVFALAAAALVIRYRRTSLPRWTMLTSLAGSLVVSGLMAWTGLLGGRIRHTELRADGGIGTSSVTQSEAVRGTHPTPH